MTIKIETFNNANNIELISVTSPYNEEFIIAARKLKGVFNKTNKSWEFPIKSKAKVEAVVYQVFGVSSDSDSEKVTIELTFLETVQAEQSNVIISGRVIAKGDHRDSGAEEGWGVEFIEGEMSTDGSRKNWYTYVKKGSVFTVSKFEKKALKLLDKNKSVSYKIIE